MTVLSVAGAAGWTGLIMGLVQSNSVLSAGSVIGLCYLAGRFAPPKRDRPAAATRSSGKKSAASSSDPAGLGETKTDDTGDHDHSSLVRSMMAAGRYALLARSQIMEDLSRTERKAALDTLHESMALMPAGPVLMRQPFGACDEEDVSDGAADRIVRVDPYYLDRHCVTNEHYRAFVVADGYRDPGLWEPETWPAVPDFIDRSGQPGPRFWHQGMYPAGEDDYPVVGINWCEAQAYARWAGKRLPTDAEWVKAASWPVAVGSERPAQRKFPWGDVMDRQLANLWGSGANRPLAVNQFPAGVSAAGLYQMCGNVWEWTSGSYGAWPAAENDSERPAPMKAIRGGAFDTYFDHQASCHFQSGDNPLARKANIGFRCALSLCDVADDPPPFHPDDEPTWEDIFGPAGGDQRR